MRERRARWGAFEWADFPEMFLERLAAEDLSDATVLDLGTGEGRLALLLAPRARIVVGIDRDEDALAAARDRARELRLTNVTFLPGDADTVNYRLLVRSPIDVVVASYFMSKAAIRATATAIRSGGKFLFACHHTDNWVESGRVGSFSFGEQEMRELLEGSGLAVSFLGLDRLVVTYDNLDVLAGAHSMLAARFKRDGRWDVLRKNAGTGEVTLTWATLVGVADKARP